MADIQILTNKIVVGTPYKSFNELCRHLVLYNGVPIGTKTNPVGSRKKSILRELDCYIETESNPKNNNALCIKNVFAIPKAAASVRQNECNIAEYMRPILKEMVNNEYQDVGIVKYHKGLTVDLNYMSNGYNELYKALQHSEFSRYGIQNTSNYAQYAMNELVNRIKSFINYYCEHLNYDGVSYYKMPVDTLDFDFLSTADQSLYDECARKSRLELEENAAPNTRIDYRKIPIMANEKFNEEKKLFNPNYEPIKLIKANIFEIDGNFQPEPQTTNPKQLNDEILKDLRRRHDILYQYTQTDEYKNILSNEFLIGTYPNLCNDKDVRQILTKKNRDNTAKDKKMDENKISLDFPLQNITDYANDIQKIINHCKI